MPQPRPDFYAGGHYHIYNRGCAGLPLFHNHENYIFVLRKMKEYQAQLKISILAYCLMPNHYHFLIRQDGDASASMFPQRIFNAYTKAYNKRYQKSGTLFQGRYRVNHVRKDSYLLHLCRYIHANPVKDGIVSQLDSWPYSNYLDWMGVRKGSMLDRNFVSEQFSAPEQYQAFVLDYLATRKLPSSLAQSVEELER